MTCVLAGSEVVEPLGAFWQETTQVHFLHALAVPEALVVLRERRERVHSLLPLSSGKNSTPALRYLWTIFNECWQPNWPGSNGL